MINCKSQSELAKMKRSGQIVRQVLDAVKALVAPGVSTMDLENAAEEKFASSGPSLHSRAIAIILACCARQ